MKVRRLTCVMATRGNDDGGGNEGGAAPVCVCVLVKKIVQRFGRCWLYPFAATNRNMQCGWLAAVG